MMKQNVLLAIGVAISVALVSVAHAALVEDMVAFDRAYIPGLALSNQPDKPATAVEESMRRLNTGWEKFLQSLSKSDRENAALGKAIAESGARIDEARKLVAAGKRAQAHEALEGVRIAFWKARTAMGIDYLPDRFTAFHEPMEEFVDLAGKPGADAGKLKSFLGELSARWSDVEKAKLDVGLFKFSGEKAGTYANMVKKEREILTQLSGILESGNQESLAKTAGAMKGNFSQTYLLFGDFTGL